MFVGCPDIPRKRPHPHGKILLAPRSGEINYFQPTSNRRSSNRVAVVLTGSNRNRSSSSTTTSSSSSRSDSTSIR
eukprot:7048772-Pyramimonas_sp.AAC.1